MKYLAALLLFTLFSCKPVELAEIKKQLVTPGQPSGVITFRYSTTIEVKNSTSIKSISVSKIDGDISTFTLTDLATGKLLSQNQVLDEGTYFIDFGVAYSEALETSIDTVSFNLEVNGKSKTVTKLTTFGTNVNQK